MPKFMHADIGDVQKTAYLQGKALNISRENDTMDVKGVHPCPNAVDVPIYYHCKHTSMLRANGALRGAAGAFYGDARVVVQCEIMDEEPRRYVPKRVTGFVLKPELCTINLEIKFTVNNTVPQYQKYLKLVDALNHIKYCLTSIVEPDKAYFSRVVLPAKIYIANEAFSPAHQDLFDYFTENPRIEHLVKMDVSCGKNTMMINGVLMEAGDKQLFYFDYPSEAWLPSLETMGSGSVAPWMHEDPTTQVFDSYIIGSQYESVMFLSRQGLAQMFAIPMKKCLSARKVPPTGFTEPTFHHFYGYVADNPGDDLFYRECEWLYWLMSDEGIFTEDIFGEGLFDNPVVLPYVANFTANVMSKQTNTNMFDEPTQCVDCEYGADDFHIGAIEPLEHYYYAPCVSFGDTQVFMSILYDGGYYGNLGIQCSSPPAPEPPPPEPGHEINLVFWRAPNRQTCGDCPLMDMGIMTDPDGHSPTIDEATVNLSCHPSSMLYWREATAPPEQIDGYFCNEPETERALKPHMFDMMLTPIDRI